MKPNFEQMSRAELKAYVLAHRDDDQAFQVLLKRRNPDDTATWYPPPLDEEGVRIMEEAFRKKIQEIENQPPTE
jgi:hypothetical protein